MFVKMEHKFFMSFAPVVVVAAVVSSTPATDTSGFFQRREI